MQTEFKNAVTFPILGSLIEGLFYFYEVNSEQNYHSFQSGNGFEDYLVDYGAKFTDIDDFKQKHPKAPVLYFDANGEITETIALEFLEKFQKLFNFYINYEYGQGAIEAFGYNLRLDSEEDYGGGYIYTIAIEGELVALGLNENGIDTFTGAIHSFGTGDWIAGNSFTPIEEENFDVIVKGKETPPPPPPPVKTVSNGIEIYQSKKGAIMIKKGEIKHVLASAYFHIHPRVKNAILINSTPYLENESGIDLSAAKVSKVNEESFSGNNHELLELIANEIILN